MNSPPKVRLADPSREAGELYNFYQLISQVSGLYVMARDRRAEEEFRDAWRKATDAILEQVGLAFHCWDQVPDQYDSILNGQGPRTLLKRSISLSNRLVVIEQTLNEWTPIERLAKTMLAVEDQIRRYGEAITGCDLNLRNTMEAMASFVEIRKRLLSEIQTKVQGDKLRWNRAYAEPVAIV